MSPLADRLRKHIVEPLKARFVGRDEVLDLIALAVVSGEHLFLYGPPGTAKSALVRQFATAVQGTTSSTCSRDSPNRTNCSARWTS